jgi:hypothetical protein
MRPHRANLILVFGILSLVVCAPLGIPAWVMGNSDLRDMSAGLMDPSGRDSTNVGRICGIIGTVFLGIGILFLILYFAIIGVVLFTVASEAEKQKPEQHIEFTPAPAR